MRGGRNLLADVTEALLHFPAVAGPRQCGKTTLAKAPVADRRGAIDLDLERPSDRRRLIRGTQKLAFEAKAALAPEPSAGFWNALGDVRPDETTIEAPLLGPGYPLREGVRVEGLNPIRRGD